MNRTGCIAALLFLLAGAPALAAGDLRMGYLADANAELASEYQTLMDQQHGPQDKAALRDLERDWIAYKRAECLFEIGGADGVLQRPGMAQWPNYADCQLRVTRARILELKGMECVGASFCALHRR